MKSRHRSREHRAALALPRCLRDKPQAHKSAARTPLGVAQRFQFEALVSLDEHEYLEARALAAEAHGIDPRAVGQLELSTWIHSLALEQVRDGAAVRRLHAREVRR